jgi:hypothetical protein
MSRRIVQKLATTSTKLHGDAILALKGNLRAAGGQLQDFVALLEILLSDENFMIALEVEGLTTMPKRLSEQLAERRRCRFQE